MNPILIPGKIVPQDAKLTSWCNYIIILVLEGLAPPCTRSRNTQYDSNLYKEIAKQKLDSPIDRYEDSQNVMQKGVVILHDRLVTVDGPYM